MIYIVANKDACLKVVAMNGRENTYALASNRAFETREDAENYIIQINGSWGRSGLGVFGVDADWDDDTYRTPHGRCLCCNAPIVVLGEHQP